jgi:hypothetical protein
MVPPSSSLGTQSGQPTPVTSVSGQGPTIMSTWSQVRFPTSLAEALDPNDTTKQQYDSAKMTVSLEVDGLNLLEWREALLDVSIMKDAHQALFEELPSTRAHSTVKQLNFASVPMSFLPILLTFSSTCKMLQWLTEKFQGGGNGEVNVLRLNRSETRKMSLTESFDDFVAGKLSMRHALSKAGHTVADRMFNLYIVNNLPDELESSK